VNPLLSTEEKKLLLDLAYDAVKATAEATATSQPTLDQLPVRLQQPAATFVTLKRDGVLRGCIGTTKPLHPLAQDIVQRARSAASSDPRFPAITPDEVSFLEIEISVLTPPLPLEFNHPDQLLQRLKPGIDGVIIRSGRHQATFLPQVWERVRDPKTFLELLCQKASLHRDAWHTKAIKVDTYQVESFHREPDNSRERSSRS
jgi:AmmeMemoRadiSam system protein A